MKWQEICNKLFLKLDDKFLYSNHTGRSLTKSKRSLTLIGYKRTMQSKLLNF